MKKIFLALGLMMFTVAFTACNQKELDAQKATIDSLQGVVDGKDAEIDDLFQMLNEIEGNLSMINSKYSSVQEMRRNNTEGTYNHKKEIADQMSSIESIMADNKAKIAQLNSRVSSLSKKNNDLQAYITKLEERSAAQEQQIAELLTELENNKVVIKGLNKNVSELTASNQQKDEYIAQQMADANRAWFIVGSYSDLKEAGIVSKTGGFIGIGRRQGTLADMPTELFTEIDRTKVTTITINMKKAQVISKHPENSYELVADEEESGVTAYLRILNPTLFWKYTDYLVVSTK
jgi:DNA repair exonuclease SbcCD ATPase subunit